MGAAAHQFAPKGLDPAVIVPEVCERMCTGELQEDIAKELGFTRAMIWHWTAGPKALPEHACMYARAKEIQAHAFGEEAMRVARLATNDNANGVRVHVDTIKWYTSKLAPRLYGEKLQIEHSAIDVKSLSDEELQLLADGKPIQRLLGPGSL